MHVQLWHIIYYLNIFRSTQYLTYSEVILMQTMPGLYVINGMQENIGTKPNGFTKVQVVSSTSLDSSKWQLLTATYTSTDANIYINGVLIASATHSYMLPDSATRTDNNLGLGSLQNSINVASLAFLDDLRIYNRDLNITEINNLMICPGNAQI